MRLLSELIDKVIPLSILACILASQGSHALDGQDVELEYELDAYYSNVGLFINLTDEPVPVLEDATEFEVYQDLLSRSLVPRFMLVEASINPMPVAGVLMKRTQMDFYEKANYAEDSNWIESLTAGFEEPWALAIFLGNRVDFSSPEHLDQQNRGFMGYLFSVGDYHIKRNVLIDDNWFEFEWKVKGDQVLEHFDLSWSFRIGLKVHSNREITDEVYLGIRRDRVQNDKEPLSFFHNGGIELTHRMDKNTGNSIGQRFIIDKKFPIIGTSAVFSLAFGLTRDTRFKYKGSLKESDAETTFLIRPGLDF